MTTKQQVLEKINTGRFRQVLNNHDFTDKEIDYIIEKVERQKSMKFTKNEIMLLTNLVNCEKCQMSDETVLPSYKAQLTKLLKKLQGGN